METALRGPSRLGHDRKGGFIVQKSANRRRSEFPRSASRHAARTDAGLMPQWFGHAGENSRCDDAILAPAARFSVFIVRSGAGIRAVAERTALMRCEIHEAVDYLKNPSSRSF